MKKTLVIFITALTLLCTTNPQRLCAIPANPTPYTITQRDGTQLTLRTIGDEFFHYTTTTDGYTVVNNPQGDYFFAQLNEQGELVSTQILARPVARLNAAERAQIQRVSKDVKPLATEDIRRQMDFRSPASVIPPWSSVAGIKPPRLLRNTTASSKGELKTLVILVETADVPFTISNPLQSFKDMLTKDGYNYNGATGSVWNYYQDNSNKQFDPQFVVVGPYQVSKPTAYYAGKNGLEKVEELVAEACRVADAEINFADFSSDGQFVHDIFIIYAGYNQSEGGGNYTIWPHRWNISDQNLYLDGVQIRGYACNSEYAGPKGQGVMGCIGNFCHEFGHVIGWPDFYDTDYNKSGGTAYGLSLFSLMDSGGTNNNRRTPPASSILERWMMGWATPKELNDKSTFTLAPVTEDDGYLIRTESDDEYFLVEYRGAGATEWDKPDYIFNTEGMVVYHIDCSTPDVWINNRINISPKHENMKLVFAKTVPTYYTEIVFPGASNARELSSEKIEHYRAWSGRAMPLVLRDISLQSGKAVTFRVETGATPACKSINLYGYEYSEYFSIALALNTNEPTEVVWYVDGSVTEESCLSLPVGEHKITAEITTEEGDKEYIIKYIFSSDAIIL